MRDGSRGPILHYEFSIGERIEERQEEEATMKGDAKVIAILNEVLKAELTAINQYFLHAEMCENWGYHRMAKQIRKEPIEETHTVARWRAQYDRLFQDQYRANREATTGERSRAGVHGRKAPQRRHQGQRSRRRQWFTGVDGKDSPRRRAPHRLAP